MQMSLKNEGEGGKKKVCVFSTSLLSVSIKLG